jgi:hypothetical protein
MRLEFHRRVFEIAKRQHGVVAYAQLASVGATKWNLHGMLRRGDWVRELPSVVRMYWADRTWMQRVWATWLWAGPKVVVSHHSAALLTGLDVAPPDNVHVCSPLPIRLVSPASWVEIHACASLKRSDIEICAGLPVTSASRTLFDLCGVENQGTLEPLLVRALRAKVVSEEEMRLRLLHAHGKRGAVALRTALQRAKTLSDRPKLRG